jgi:hypothetical protein
MQAQQPNFGWTQYPISHGYITAYQGAGTDTPHYADDVATPFHTPITALLSGTIIQADYAPWGGEVFIRTPSGQTYYYYHLDLLYVQAGQSVVAGQILGLSGGQNSGGLHPVSTQWSTGPHTHVGWFTGFVQSPNGTIPYGPDVTPLIQAARQGSTAGFSGGGTGTTGVPAPVSPGGAGTTATGLLTILPGQIASVGPAVQATLANVPGFYGIALALDELERFPGIVPCANGVSANGNTDFTIFGVDTGIGNPFAQTQQAQADFGSIFCTIFSTITANATAFIFRFIVVFIGLLLLLALFFKAGSGIAEQIAPIMEAAA